MKTAFGIILITAGVAIGLYVGVWLMFIGGMLDIVEFIRQDLAPTSTLAWGVAKIVFASFVGQLSAIALVLPGIAVMRSEI